MTRMMIAAACLMTMVGCGGSEEDDIAALQQKVATSPVCMQDPYGNPIPDGVVCGSNAGPGSGSENWEQSLCYSRTYACRACGQCYTGQTGDGITVPPGTGGGGSIYGIPSHCASACLSCANLCGL
jgi:hypothetical protein